MPTPTVEETFATISSSLFCGNLFQLVSWVVFSGLVCFAEVCPPLCSQISSFSLLFQVSICRVFVPFSTFSATESHCFKSRFFCTYESRNCSPSDIVFGVSFPLPLSKVPHCVSSWRKKDNIALLVFPTFVSWFDSVFVFHTLIIAKRGRGNPTSLGQSFDQVSTHTYFPPYCEQRSHLIPDLSAQVQTIYGCDPHRLYYN